MNDKLIELIERMGYINAKGERIYGTAALVHVLHCPCSTFVTPKNVERGRSFVESFFSA